MKIINKKTKENSVCQDVSFTFTEKNQTKTFNDFKTLKNDDFVNGVLLVRYKTNNLLKNRFHKVSKLIFFVIDICCCCRMIL